MSNQAFLKDIYNTAIHLLSRREYAVEELRKKLREKFSNPKSSNLKRKLTNGKIRGRKTADENIDSAFKQGTDIRHCEQLGEFTRHVVNQDEHRDRYKDETREEYGDELDLDHAITNIISKLLEQGYLSNERFLRSFIGSRCERGYGPLRIAQDLRQKGFSADEAETALSQYQNVFQDKLEFAFRKKFKQKPEDLKEKQRCIRFLLNRGFDYQTILDFLNGE